MTSIPVSSWVIVSLETGETVAETFSGTMVAALRTGKYKAVPILTYLGELNRKIRERGYEGGTHEA